MIVHFGGKLQQNIDLGAHGHSGDKRYELVHPIYFPDKYKELEARLIKKGTIPYKKDEEKVLWTNSLHHQAARVATDKREGDVPDCFDVVAYSGDLYAEAIRHKTLPISGCQNHVEEDNTILATYLFEELVKKAIHDKRNKESKRETVESV